MKSSCLLTDLRNTTFKKNVTYDTIKTHKKPGLQTFSEKKKFGKTRVGSNWPPNPSTFLGLSKKIEKNLKRQLILKMVHNYYSRSYPQVLIKKWSTSITENDTHTLLKMFQNCYSKNDSKVLIKKWFRSVTQKWSTSDIPKCLLLLLFKK